MKNRPSKPDMINQIVDLLDDAIMKCYYGMIDEEVDNTDVTNYNIEKGRLNYYDCFLMVVDYFLNDVELKVDEDTRKVIDECLDTFKDLTEKYEVNSEEIRRALLLLDIKAFKSVNFPLDIITPDAIGMIIANFINAMYTDVTKVDLLDFNFGIGNLAFTISNHSVHDISLVGFENHSLLASVSVKKANLMMQNLNLFFQDALEALPKDIDVIVSDIASYDYENPNYASDLYNQGVRYFPYLAIEHFLKIENKVLAIYIVENNFFSKPYSNLFYDMMNKFGHIDALITLPTNFFQSKEDAKSIIIVSNEIKDNCETAIYMLPSLSDKENFLKQLESICTYIKTRKEELK